MSLEDAEANLKEFGKILNLDLTFDENHVCTVTLDSQLLLLLSQELNAIRLKQDTGDSLRGQTEL